MVIIPSVSPDKNQSSIDCYKYEAGVIARVTQKLQLFCQHQAHFPATVVCIWSNKGILWELIRQSLPCTVCTIAFWLNVCS